MSGTWHLRPHMQEKPQRGARDLPGDASDDKPAQREAGEKHGQRLGVGARLRSHPYITTATVVLIVAVDVVWLVAAPRPARRAAEFGDSRARKVLLASTGRRSWYSQGHLSPQNAAH